MAAKTKVPEGGGAIETQIQNLDATLVRQQILQLSPLPKAPPRGRKRQGQAAAELTPSPYKESLENAQASKRGMGRGVRARGGTARRGYARDTGRERPARGRALTNARGAGTAVGLRPTRREECSGSCTNYMAESQAGEFYCIVCGERSTDPLTGLDSVRPVQGMGS